METHPQNKLDFNYIADGIKGKSPEEAEAFIKSKRPSMHLEDVQRAALQDFSRKTS